jgi:hypothetical protein
MSRIFGWSLPPGVTRLPGDEPDEHEPGTAHRCKKCRAFLPVKPTRIVPREDSWDCNGKVREYKEEYSESVIQILGEEYRGKQATIRMTDCDLEREHKPHKVVAMMWEDHVFVCRRCGTETVHHSC